MNCQKCGSELMSDAAFCDNCGTPVQAPPAPPEQEPPKQAPPAPPEQVPPEQVPPAPLDQAPPTPPAPPAPGSYAPPTYTYAPPPDDSQNSSKGKKKTGLILGIAGGVVLLLALATFIVFGTGRILGDIFNNTGDDVFGDVSDIPDEEPLTDEEKFDLLMDELFADWVAEDTLTMNYYLADPYSLNIERPEPTYGEVISPEIILESKEETQELADRLDEIEYESLRIDQQIVYDILARNIVLYKIIEKNEDYSYYTGYIRPLLGLQVQLPILLAEFSFYTAEDIGRYLDLLEDTRRYFDDIIEFERERSRRGFFLSEANVDSVIEHIEDYLENREDNLLITVFDDKIDNYNGLSSEQRESYKQRNKDLILGNVLPAYDTLLSAMRELRGVGANKGGLADLPGGKEYAHASLSLRVGTDRSATELGELLNEWLDMIFTEIINTLHGDPQVYEKLMKGDLGQIDDGTPESYISALQKHITADFPPMDTTQLTLLEVHESLQEHMSPAFYLSPAVDRFNENVVYINPASINDNLFLFTVLAHESYPGHLYQTVYFLQQTPHPVRVSLSSTGYVEGWATYTEMRSYFFTALDNDEANLMWNFRFFDMLLQSCIDLGVNALGWSFEDVVDFLYERNYTDIQIAESIYNRVTGVPLNSLVYSLGYIELFMLLESAEERLGEDFDLMDFHRFFLEFGPAPFPIIRKYMDAQIAENPSQLLAPAA